MNNDIFGKKCGWDEDNISDLGHMGCSLFLELSLLHMICPWILAVPFGDISSQTLIIFFNFYFCFNTSNNNRKS